MNPRTLRVAAVQVVSRPAEPTENLAAAEVWVAEAARQGAALVICPELLAAGYVYDARLWRAAERHHGATERWLARLAQAHAIHLGASYLESDGKDFFNTFALAAPTGAIVGRVRKESRPGFESWFFAGSHGSRVLDTALGRIAVGICQDNHTARFYEGLLREAPDLVVMPHSAPYPARGAELVRQSLREIAPFYARSFGVPVVLANKADSSQETPIPVWPRMRTRFGFPGLSCVCDSDGTVVDRLGSEPGIAIGDVVLDPRRRRTPGPPRDRYWSLPPPGFPRLTAVAYRWLERIGSRAYARDARRAAAARVVPESPVPR